MPVSRFAVFGHPIAHSLSPRIHTEFGRQMGVALNYLAFDVAPDAFRVSLERFVAEGGCGANVTLPLKEAAFEVCTTLSARARRAGAVNTLSRVDGVWHGENTDGTGLVRNLTERHGLICVVAALCCLALVALHVVWLLHCWMPALLRW